MKFRELREQIERPQPPIIIEAPRESEIPPVLRIDRVEKAIDYIKGYCNKHLNCSERCRLYDTEDGCCMFFDGSAGTPCDWEMPKREEEKDV